MLAFGTNFGTLGCISHANKSIPTSIMRLRIFLIAALILFAYPAPSFSQISVQLETAFPNLSFSRPVDIQHAGDGSNRLFVLEQHEGRIRSFQNDQGVTSADIFLEINGIGTEDEEGLLGLAFHPDFESNGFFFVNYSARNPRRSVISRFNIAPTNPNVADPTSELVILEVIQPYPNHNGGQLFFHPDDGFLYIGLGDGGSGGDPDDNGKDPKTLLGSILRIDVNNASEANPYEIPADNPFVGNTDGFKEEIFAYGLRNPWRMSVDPETGNIWAGDVGQSAREEIDIIENGGHYGWNTMEGMLCFPSSVNCNRSGLDLPVWEYNRGVGTSVTGGYVYRGTRVPELIGKYIYGDFVSRRIWALTVTDNDTTNVEIVRASFNIPAFGVSENNELFIAGFDGKLHRFVETEPTSVTDPSLPEAQHQLGVSFPNPTASNTTIPFTLGTSAEIELAIFDMLGRKVSVVASGTFPAGEHQATWTRIAEDTNKPLPAGTYFYSLRVNQTVTNTRILTLLK